MSFKKYKTNIDENDTVILYLGFANMHAIKVVKGQTFQTKFGALRLSNLVGKPYGSKIECPKGYLYVIYPTPELWTQNLPHRTQILYSTDISLVILQLDLKPGSVVVESGMDIKGLMLHFVHAILNKKLYNILFHFSPKKISSEEHHSISTLLVIQMYKVVYIDE